jgi:RNA polymerase sigma factor (sigma-70 family)
VYKRGLVYWNPIEIKEGLPHRRRIHVSGERTFSDFVARIRSGDEQAATDLVRQFEPLIRREIRMHLDDHRLSRLFDSLDICQSVLASFFLRTSVGEYDLERPEQLVALLVTMARNKLASAARRERRECRDSRRVTEMGAQELKSVPDMAADPGKALSTAEMLERFRLALSDEERQIVVCRSEGLAWAEVAAKLGGTAQSRRMQLTRAVERVVNELGIESADL